MVVAVCGITFAFQTNTYAKKNFKVTPSKVEKQSKKSFRTITTKYTKHYLGLNAFLDKMEKAGNILYIKCHLCAIQYNSSV